jgi:hypothetical protein
MVVMIVSVMLGVAVLLPVVSEDPTKESRMVVMIVSVVSEDPIKESRMVVMIVSVMSVMFVVSVFIEVIMSERMFTARIAIVSPFRAVFYYGIALFVKIQTFGFFLLFY